jgi:hypothetical protein
MPAWHPENVSFKFKGEVKMKKNFLVGVIGIVVLLAVVFVIYWTRVVPEVNPPYPPFSKGETERSEQKPSTTDDKANLTKKDANTKVVDVDEIVKHPDQFKGTIEVVGKVIEVDESKTFFALGCEDACVMIPVKYKGQMPELESYIIVSGEIKESEGGRYIFEGQEVKVR